GFWNISYDLYVNNIGKPPPDGWGISRGTIYRRIIAYLRLNGFTQSQYSIYQSAPFAVASATFLLMVDLRRLRPAGIFPSVIRRLHMSLMPTLILDVTNNIRLGGQSSPVLLGMTPRNLV
ncbi:hypothetical protein EV359DRAFT_25261, partial [Lentinula novae-zelandiae]